MSIVQSFNIRFLLGFPSLGQCVNDMSPFEAHLSAFLLLDPISCWRKSCIFSPLFEPVFNIYNSDKPDSSVNIEWVLLGPSEVPYIMTSLTFLPHYLRMHTHLKLLLVRWVGSRDPKVFQQENRLRGPQ